ncbi:HD-GYP domain-containing protein [Bacillus sp. Marseille-Q3570]|uniref:HD-GYP domain-containing protein n=1 Tax=Bacillus sp. Marseille-Q3570 TaxID=2963522 RepID=UPI0021B70CBF|nr:HD domain-containing phosphohydrolase [Bacillus sp. Marseille-Q3570]
MEEKYTLQELSDKVGKHQNIVEEWFEELHERFEHHNVMENGEYVYDQTDLKIGLYIAEKRDERLPFDDIFNKIGEVFCLKATDESDDLDTGEIETETNEKLLGLGRDPESLFYEIAQDNEIIEMFKYHSLRVMFLASMLAKRVGCYDEDLRIAALLHDIGKMGISKNILLKQGKLSELEYTIIQSHSHIGNVIVRKHLGLTRAAKFIRDHHERWDGTGYPRRLVGDEITVQGRIISICDAFDTMTIDRRNYKKQTLSYDEAFEELQACAWTQFDGNLIQKFISIREEITIPEFMLQEV